ncbi:MAG: lipopolysaccharide biosynthesis protein [Muribaculaceae bacterium]|nr:lipopolysaccharide biosynthesis protein [Muribaculaceae bacterium]
MGFRTAIIWNGVSQLGTTGITFISNVILARLLTPDDYAIIGLVTIFIAFSQMMVDSEMGGALLRKPTVTRTDYSTLFYYNLAVSLFLFTVLYFIAPLIAKFYSLPQLTEVVRVLSLTIIIQAFRVVQRIMIFREFKFKTYAVINLISGIVSLAVAILMALRGYGYWALIWQQIVQALCNLILMETYNRFIPALTFSKESFKYQFSFGISLLGSNTVSTIANNISTNIIGKISSIEFTGYYTQVSKLTNFCQSSIGPILDQSVFPILAKYDKVEDIRATYYRFLKLLTMALIALSVLCILFARPIISLVLGDQWLGGAFIFQILSLGMLPATLQILCRTILKTLGTTKRVLYLETIKSVIIIALLIGAAFINSDFVVWAVVISQMISCVIWLIATEKELKHKLVKVEEA